MADFFHFFAFLCNSVKNNGIHIYVFCVINILVVRNGNPNINTNKKGKRMSVKKINPTAPSPKAQSSVAKTPEEKANTILTIKPKTGRTASVRCLEKVSEGLGCLVNWKTGKTIWKASEIAAKAMSAGLPTEVTDTIKPNSTRMAVSVAIEDSKWKRMRKEGKKIEVSLVHEDKNGNQTYGFLGWEKDGNDENAKASRKQFDRVCLGSDRKWLYKGQTEEAATFCNIVDFHLEHLSASDINTKVTTPMLGLLQSCRVGSASYFVRQTPENDELIEKWSSFMAEIDFELFPMTLAFDKRTQSSLVSGATADMTKRLEVQVNKIAEWKKKNRVHARSRDVALRELGKLMTDAELVEDALETKLKSLTDAINSAIDEANDIIKTTAPAGISAPIFAAMSKLLEREDKVLETTPHGKVYFFLVPEFTDFLANGKISPPARKCLRSLGYFHYIESGVVILRPLAEITNRV